jgi:hypothetical protein
MDPTEVHMIRKHLFLAALLCAASSVWGDEKPVLADIGISFKTVYYRTGTTAPFVGFEVDQKDFRAGLTPYLNKESTREMADALFDVKNLAKLSGKYWKIGKVTTKPKDGKESIPLYWSGVKSEKSLKVQTAAKEPEKNPIILVLWETKDQTIPARIKVINDARKKIEDSAKRSNIAPEKASLDALSREEEMVRKETLDPWARYKVSFDLAGYAAEVLGNIQGPRAVMPGTVVTQGDAEKKSFVLRRSGYASLDAKSSLTPAKADLITGKWVQDKKTKEYSFQNRQASSSVISVDYKDTMFRLGFQAGHKRVGEMTVGAVISDYPIDKRSSIEVRLGGVTRTSYATSVNAQYLGLRTSQSLSRTDIFAEQIWRFGDHRGEHDGDHEDADYPKFMEEKKITDTATIDFGAEAGGTIVKPLLYVDLRSSPTGDPIPKLFFRPFARINLFEDSFFGGRFKVSGKVQVWYLGDKISGVQTDVRFAERAELSFAHEDGRVKLSFGVTAGRNPSSSFDKIIPTYSFGLGVKF